MCVCVWGEDVGDLMKDKGEEKQSRGWENEFTKELQVCLAVLRAHLRSVVLNLKWDQSRGLCNFSPPGLAVCVQLLSG